MQFCIYTYQICNCSAAEYMEEIFLAPLYNYDMRFIIFRNKYELQVLEIKCLGVSLGQTEIK
jgi:hypothetical protein